MDWARVQTFVKGSDSCTASAGPNPLCYVFVGAFLLWWVANVLTKLSGREDKDQGCPKGEERPGNAGWVSGIGLLVQLFLLVLMVYHCVACDGRQGIIKVLVIGVLWAIIAVAFTPSCQEKETFDPITANLALPGYGRLSFRGEYMLIRVSEYGSPVNLLPQLGRITQVVQDDFENVIFEFDFTYQEPPPAALGRVRPSPAENAVTALTESDRGRRAEGDLEVELNVMAELGLEGTYVLLNINSEEDPRRAGPVCRDRDGLSGLGRRQSPGARFSVHRPGTSGGAE